MNGIATFFRESLLARFLIPAGFFITIFGVAILVINLNNQNYVKIESSVSKVEIEEEEHYDSDDNLVEATYEISVKYTVDGKEYEGVLVGLPKYDIGEKMTIYYNPDDPTQITQTKSLILPIVLIVGGIAAFTGGIISGINSYKRYKKMKDQEKGWAANGK